MQIVRQQSPEDRELDNKRTILAALESDLATRELELATLHATLKAFEHKYLTIVDLVARIITASLETQKLDNALLKEFAEIP